MKLLLALLAAIFAIGISSAQAADSLSSNTTPRHQDLSYWHHHHHHHYWHHRHHHHYWHHRHHHHFYR